MSDLVDRLKGGFGSAGGRDVQIRAYHQICKDAAKRIEKLEGEKKTRNDLLEKLLYSCDGMKCEHVEDNRGEARKWMYHIVTDLDNYMDAIYEGVRHTDVEVGE